MQQAAWSDPTAGLASADADAALLRLPFPGQDDVRIEVLLTEPRGVALPATHRLAACEQISFRQLWDEPFVAAPTETGWWRDYWLATGERQGHPVRIGYVTDQPDAWLTAIAKGYGIALAPESAARHYARPGIIYRPVTGVSPGQAGVAWPPANDTDPSSRTSSAAAWTTSRHNMSSTNLTSSNSREPDGNEPDGSRLPNPGARRLCDFGSVFRVSIHSAYARGYERSHGPSWAPRSRTEPRLRPEA